MLFYSGMLIDEGYKSYRYSEIKMVRLGYAGMIALVVMAAIFYRERAWFLDIAYQTFLMVNEGSVQVMVNRFGSAIVQLLPLLAIKTGAPLTVVSLLYSVSFPFLFLVFYWLTVSVLRNEWLGWAIVFLYTLIVFDAFYWATSEQQQGLGAVLVFFAYWLRYPKQEKPWQWMVSILSVILLAYYHPLVFIPFFFLWAYFGLHLRQQLAGNTYWWMAVGMLAVLILKYWLSANWYDTAKYSTFSENLVAYFPNYWQLPANGKFFENVFKLWYLFPVFLISLTVYYGYRKHWLKLGLVWVTCIGYLLLLHIAAPQATNRFYVEVNYMALSIFVAVPFLFEIAPLLPSKTLFWGFTGILILRLATIAGHHTPFEARWRWIEETLVEQDPIGNRLYLTADQAPMDILLSDWSIAYESLIISNCSDRINVINTLVVDPGLPWMAEYLESDSAFISPLKAYTIDELSEDYFPLGTGYYQKLTDDKNKGAAE